MSLSLTREAISHQIEDDLDTRNDNKGLIETAVNAKAEQATTYTKTETDSLLDEKETIANVDALKGVGWSDENLTDHETRIDDLESQNFALGIKFEGLPASTIGTRMAGAIGKTFRVNSGSMNLDAYPDTDIRFHPIYSRIKTAKINDSFEVQAYLDEPRFAGASGHVMTWIPKFYSRIVNATEFYIRPTLALGYSIEPAFYDYVNNKERDGVWIGSLPGTLDSSDGTSVLDSLIGKAFQVNRTMMQLRTSAKANGTGFGLMDIATREMLRKLFLIAVADTNSQAVVGSGVTSLENSVLVTENNFLAMGNESGYIGTDTKVPVCFFGIWDLWGNIWQWVDGIFKTSGGLFYTYDEIYYDAIIGTVPATLSNYEEHTESLPLTNGYQGAIAGSPAVPSSLTGGGSATGLCDYFSQDAGYRGLLVGGVWNNGSSAGFFCWNMGYAPSALYSSLGSRLFCKP